MDEWAVALLLTPHDFVGERLKQAMCYQAVTDIKSDRIQQYHLHFGDLKSAAQVYWQ